MKNSQKRIEEIISQCRLEKRNVLLEPEAEEVLSLYEVSFPKAKVVKTIEEAKLTAKRLGFPVALKVISPQIVHKSDAGGVKVGLRSENEMITAFQEIMENTKNFNPDAEIRGVYLQKMASPDGREVIVGATTDAQFGQVIMFGLGGIFVEVLKDVVFRVAPVSRKEAKDMVKEIKGISILEGVRGKGPIDFDALHRTISNISRLVIDFPQFKELDVNPLYAYEDKILAVDARIILAK